MCVFTAPTRKIKIKILSAKDNRFEFVQDFKLQSPANSLKITKVVTQDS